MSIVEIPHESEVADITDNRARNACLTDSSCRASRPTNWVEISTLILVLAVLLIEVKDLAEAKAAAENAKLRLLSQAETLRL